MAGYSILGHDDKVFYCAQYSSCCLHYCRLQMESVQKPKREVQQLTGVVNMYKPVSDHQHNVSFNSLYNITLMVVNHSEKHSKL